jgi:hypothetical protein
LPEQPVFSEKEVPIQAPTKADLKTPLLIQARMKAIGALS